MGTRYQIHPALGITRVGNSDESFYLAPESIGGLPLECDEYGNEVRDDGSAKHVRHFKDDEGRIRRQAERFRLFAYDDASPGDPGREVTLDDPDILTIEWVVHLANKKPIWYRFTVYAGDLMFSEDNTYQAFQVPLRNADTTGPDRQKLIIDPGPRRISGRNLAVPVSKDNVPADYPHASFPDVSEPDRIDSLGELRTDAKGRLILLGGKGNAGGDFQITLFTGADGWFDDTSDGPVTCTVTLKDGTTATARAWVSTAAPKFAPELVNIVTLDDIQFDLAVRYQEALPNLYSDGQFNSDYKADFERDIQPIVRRIADYPWVSNVPSMVAFAAPQFDMRDASERNRANRKNYLRYFRIPAKTLNVPAKDNGANFLLTDNRVPMMPLNSGTNSNFSVSDPSLDTHIEKFLCLTDTQYFLMSQWAAGKFTLRGASPRVPGVHSLDRASVGNCVGSPMCPGVEVTWNTRNPVIYEAPYRIKHRFGEDYYREHGLSTQEYDETDVLHGADGCEPGDLTKRLSSPWQADFFQCSVQHVNFNDPSVCVDSHYLPIPPTYFVYWWPPQSPMQVISGVMSKEEQQVAGIDAGVQVDYQRGINSYAEMIVGWTYLGFVLNQNTGPDRKQFPYFVETQRKHDEFIAASVAVGDPSNIVNATDTTFRPVWFMKNRNIRKKPKRIHAPHLRSN